MRILDLLIFLFLLNCSCFLDLGNRCRKLWPGEEGYAIRPGFTFKHGQLRDKPR